jgi:hypothetical protein
MFTDFFYAEDWNVLEFSRMKKKSVSQHGSTVNQNFIATIPKLPTHVSLIRVFFFSSRRLNVLEYSRMRKYGEWKLKNYRSKRCTFWFLDQNFDVADDWITQNWFLKVQSRNDDGDLFFS